MNKNRWLAITAISLTLVGGPALLLSGCKDSSTAGQRQMPPQKVQVVVAKATSADIKTALPARTNAFRIAEIRPQVSGTILKRQFIEGSDIEEGQSLYLIDPGIYQATYNSAKADAEVKQLTLNRYKSLLAGKSISREDYDKASAAYTQAKATLDNAEINLAYTKVYSPIKGRISTSNVTEGALVTSGQATPLTTVQQLDPIYVDMTQSSTQYLRLLQERAEGKLVREEGKPIIKLILENGQPYELEGTLQFSGVTVNETTGSISLRAIFPNPKNVLLPGMFVHASVYEGTQQDVFLIPQKAVTRDAKGKTSVKIVGEGNVVETRSIKVSEAIGSNWVVIEGLKEGDKVVTAGLQKIADKSVVEIRDNVAPTEKLDNNEPNSPQQS